MMLEAVSSDDYTANAYIESGDRYDTLVIIARQTGEADIKVRIMGKDATGEYTIVCDEKVIKVTADFTPITEDPEEPTEPDVPFPECPILENEWRYGEDIVVQVWSNGGMDIPMWQRETDPKAILYVVGTGAMDAEYCEYGIPPWQDFDLCEYESWITEAYISEGITSIEDLDCSYLEKVSFPSTLKRIGAACFLNAALTEVILPEGLETIEMGAFFRVDELEKVVLPSTLKSIGGNAFRATTNTSAAGKNQLKEIVIPKSVEYIGYGAFGCRWGLNIILEEGTDTSAYSEGWAITGFP